MRYIFELSKYDLWWLEDKFARYRQLDREIAVRKDELKKTNEDENIGGGKSNVPCNPIESQVVREQSDEFILTRQKWKKGIRNVHESCTDLEKSILVTKFWSNQNYLSWEEVGKIHHISKTTAYDVRYSIMERVAKEIGYI